MKILKCLFVIGIAVGVVLLTINFGIDTLIYIISVPFALLLLIAIIVNACNKGNGFTREEDAGKPSFIRTYENYRGSDSSFKVPKNVSWHSDKTYVPGAGYRDTQGQYYNANHVPIVTPVNTNDK